MENMKTMNECQAGASGCASAHNSHEVRKAGSDMHSPDAQKETQVEKVEHDNSATYMPAVDIIDNADEALLLLDLPGVAEADVDLTLEKSVLIIKAHPREATVEGKELIYSEFGVGAYRRSFSLTEDIDVEGISASMKDGVLKVKLPKRAPVTKKISVASNA